MYTEIFQMLVDNHALIIERINTHIGTRENLIKMAENMLNNFRCCMVDSRCPVKSEELEYNIDCYLKSIKEANKIKEDYVDRMIELFKQVKNDYRFIAPSQWVNYVYKASDALNVYNIKTCYQRSYIEKIAALQTEVWNKTEKWFTINKE